MTVSHSLGLTILAVYFILREIKAKKRETEREKKMNERKATSETKRGYSELLQFYGFTMEEEMVITRRKKNNKIAKEGEREMKIERRSGGKKMAKGEQIS